MSNITLTRNACQTLYTSGMIRNASGTLIGFYDKECGMVLVNSPIGDYGHEVKVSGEIEAMEFVGKIRGTK